MVLQNIDEAGTGLNNLVLKGDEEAVLRPGDVISVVERSFRYENPHFTIIFPEDLANASSTAPKALEAVLDEIVPGSAQKTPRRLLQQQAQSPAKTGFSVTPSNGSPFRAEGDDLTASTPNKFTVTPLKLQEATPKASPRASTPHCTPLPATSKLAQSPINRTPSGSTLGSAQKTPRTPRATVPGSPTVVDSEIVASPKFGKGELYEYPKTSLSNEAINQEDLAEACDVSATPCAARNLASPFKPTEAQTLIDVEAAPVLEVSEEPVANLMDIDLAPITTCPAIEKPDLDNAEETETVSVAMEAVEKEAKTDQTCDSVGEPSVQDNQDTCTDEGAAVAQAEAQIEDEVMSPTEEIVAENSEDSVSKDVLMAATSVEEAEVIETIVDEPKEMTVIPVDVEEQFEEATAETTTATTTEEIKETTSIKDITVDEELVVSEVLAANEDSPVSEAVSIDTVEKDAQVAIEVVPEIAPELAEPVESTESLVDPNVPAIKAATESMETAIPTTEAESQAAEPTEEDLALINSLRQEEMTPRRSTRQSSPFSVTRLTAKKASSGVSTPLKASSSKDSLVGSPMKETEETRYVLNVSPQAMSARKTPASTVGRRRRGEQLEESRSPSLRNKPAANEDAIGEEVDSENMAPAGENENVATQSSRKRGRPRKSETTNDVLTPRTKSARTN